jgi:hypothetical protein
MGDRIGSFDDEEDNRIGNPPQSSNPAPGSQWEIVYRDRLATEEAETRRRLLKSGAVEDPNKA